MEGSVEDPGSNPSPSGTSSSFAPASAMLARGLEEVQRALAAATEKEAELEASLRRQREKEDKLEEERRQFEEERCVEGI